MILVLSRNTLVMPVYNKKLAQSQKLASSLRGTRIELVEDFPKNIRICHAVFDQDGTLSKLRRGWENIMEPMMIRCVIGDMERVPMALLEEIKVKIRDFIDRTTGIQTLAQMQGLVNLVKEYNLVPDGGVLDAFGYKNLYNRELMRMINARISDYHKKKIRLNNLRIRGSIAFLRKLSNLGIKLHLASGTDLQDVISEATFLGYASFFSSEIYGAVGDLKKEAKGDLINGIIEHINLKEEGLLVVGDGPVEMEKGRAAGSICLGVASDEFHDSVINQSKRQRLIRSGAHLICSDFSDVDTLCSIIGI